MKEVKEIAFTCCVCKEPITDSQYSRPCWYPANVCYSCTQDIFELQDKLSWLSENEDKKSRQSVMLYMLSAGFNQQEIADSLKISRRQLQRLIRRIRNTDLELLDNLRQEINEQHKNKDIAKQQSRHNK